MENILPILKKFHNDSNKFILFIFFPQFPIKKNYNNNAKNIIYCMILLLLYNRLFGLRKIHYFVIYFCINFLCTEYNLMRVIYSYSNLIY